MKKYSLLIVTIILSLVFGRLVMNYQDRYISTEGDVNLSGDVADSALVEAIMLKNYLPERQDAEFAAHHICSVLKKGEELTSLYDLNKRAWRIPVDSIKTLDPESHYYKILEDELVLMGVDNAFRALNKEALSSAVNLIPGEGGSISVSVNREVKGAGNIAKLLGRDKKPCSDVIVRLDKHYIDTLRQTKTEVLAYAKTDASGKVTFKGLPLSSAYSVIPVREGFEYGSSKGTVGGTLGQVGEDGELECSFMENEHRIKVFSNAALKNIKSDHVITVRSLKSFFMTMGLYVGVFFAAWWLLFFLYKRRHRGADGSLISIMMALTGICLLMMFSMNDPLNDKMIGVDMAQGVIAGIFVMILLQAVDFKAFYQDRSRIPFDIPAAFIKWIFKPYRMKVEGQTEILTDSSAGVARKIWALVPIFLCLPFLLLDPIQVTRLYPKVDALFARLPKGFGYMLVAVLLTMLLFTPLGVAVGGMKVNLNIGILFQPSEIAKYLIVIFMAAFFCANAETIVRFSQKGNVDLFGVKMRMLGGIILGLGFLMGMYLLLGDMGPSMVLAFTFIIMYSAIKSKVDLEGLDEKRQLRHILTCDLAMLVYGIASFIVMLYVGNLLGLMWLFCLVWFLLWIGIGLVRKQIFESAIVFNLIIAAFVFGASIMGVLPGLDSVAERLESRNEMCTNTWGVLPIDGQTADPGENTQVAEGLWGLASGGFTGQGIGNGSPNVIPAFHTDMILASIGEQFGFIGLLIVVVLLALLLRKSILHGYSSANPFAFYICLGIAVVTGVQFVIIALGSTGIIPLTGVTVPFFSFGKVSMILNLAAFGIVLSIAGRNADQAPRITELEEMRRRQMSRYDYSISIISMVFCVLAVFILGVFINYTTFARDETLIRPVYVNNINGMPVVNYNPRIAMVAQKMPIGKITDRNGIILASSDLNEILAHKADYLSYGVDSAAFETHLKSRLRRYYPFGDHLFFMLGDYNTQFMFTSSGTRGYMAEEEHLSYLRGYNDRMKKDGEFVKVTLQSDEFSPGKYFSKDSTYTVKEVQIRDYSPLLTALKTGEMTGTHPQDLQLTLDARLQTMIQNNLKEYVRDNNLKHKSLTRISAVVLDAVNGDLLASAVYPLPDQTRLKDLSDKELNLYSDNNRNEAWTAYSDMDLGLLYETAPGSTAKMLTAMAGLKQEGVGIADTLIWIDREEAIRRGEPSGVRLDMKTALQVSSNPFFIHLLNSCDLYETLVNIYSVIGCDIDNIDPEFLRENNRMRWIEGALQLTKGAVRKYDDYMASTDRYKLNNGRFPTCWAWAWGQGGANTLKASPLAMARVISIAANGGYLPQTRYVIDADNPSAKTQVLSRHEAAELKKMLGYNVNGYADYAGYYSFRNVKGKENIGGKSGTPQRNLIGVEDNVSDGWFICYIDNASVGREKTTLAVAVRIERGGGSSSAASITAQSIIPSLQSLNYIK